MQMGRRQNCDAEFALAEEHPPRPPHADGDILGVLDDFEPRTLQGIQEQYAVAIAEGLAIAESIARAEGLAFGGNPPPSCFRPSSSHEQPSIANQLPALTSDSLSVARQEAHAKWMAASQTCIGGLQTGIECPCHERFGWDAKNCPSWKMSEPLDTWSFEQGLRSVDAKVAANRPELHKKWRELYKLWEKSTSCPEVEPYLKHVSIAVHQVRSCSTYHFQLLCVSCGHCSALMYCE